MCILYYMCQLSGPKALDKNTFLYIIPLFYLLFAKIEKSILTMDAKLRTRFLNLVIRLIMSQYKLIPGKKIT